MKFSTSTATFLVAALALNAQKQKILRGGGDNIEAGDITNSRKLQAVTNGSQKCIACSPAKYIEIVWGKTNTRDAPVRIIFQHTIDKCSCITAEFFFAQDSSYDYSIEYLGEKGSCFLHYVRFNAKVGSFSTFPTDTSALYTVGDRCGSGKRRNSI